MRATAGFLTEPDPAPRAESRSPRSSCPRAVAARETVDRPRRFTSSHQWLYPASFSPERKHKFSSVRRAREGGRAFVQTNFNLYSQIGHSRINRASLVVAALAKRANARGGPARAVLLSASDYPDLVQCNTIADHFEAESQHEGRNSLDLLPAF